MNIWGLDIVKKGGTDSWTSILFSNMFFGGLSDINKVDTSNLNLYSKSITSMRI